MAEYKGFVFAVLFILVFAAIFGTMPTAFYGTGETEATVPIPVNASLLNDFTDSESYNKSFFSGYGVGYIYSYNDLGGRNWVNIFGSSTFYLDAKVYVLGLWLGQTESVKCISPTGTDRGYGLSLSEINTDATDGQVRYELLFTGSGLSAGALILYWNSTLYSTASDAWTAGALWLVHGVGIADTANTNIISLLLQLLLLQLPNVPSLVNILIAGIPWTCIIYIIWFIIKESLPFV